MAKEPSPGELLSQIHELADKLPRERTLPPATLKTLRDNIAELIGKLSVLHAQLDYIRQPEYVFDPSDPKVVGTLIGRTLLEQPLHELASIEGRRFYGSGVYAIYYSGDFDAYRPIKGTSVPIYLGKVDPAVRERQ